MYGWNGKLLRANLTKGKTVVQKYDPNLAKNFLGGRGFAVKILWDELEPGVDALSPDNKLIFATGPLTGLGLPSSGKLVVAAKSPLTSGYGDGNIGTMVTVQMRRAGYDAIVIEGKAQEPVIIRIEDERAELLDGKDFWGLGSFQTEKQLKSEYQRSTGVVSIGPAGENQVKYATIVSQEGRSGGRPGIGAVMGSKNLKAIAINGTGKIPTKETDELKKLGLKAYREVLEKPNYGFWKRQGTMATIEWSQENSVLPTCNYKEGVFDQADQIGGFTMEELKVANRGCPQCNMTCGNVIEDADKRRSELDYENVAMLGSNIGLGNLKKIAALNRLADDYGIDTISLGNAIGFAMEASERNLIDHEIEWGNYDMAHSLLEEIVKKQGKLGTMLAEGVQYASEKLRKGTSKWAMHVKGLPISAYDCHTTPGMALSFATSSIGAHHKDAWIISWEVKTGRETYGDAKVDKIIELQRLRGGVFECLTTCRLPWIEVGLELKWYPEFVKTATGHNISMYDLYTISDRVFNLIRAFWIREYGSHWTMVMDIPPARWFDEPLTKGPLKGTRLNRPKYDSMLQVYYGRRGWDNRGIPMKKTLTKLGLQAVAHELSKKVELTD